MKCRSCGHEIAANAIVCYRCGTPTAIDSPPRPPAVRSSRNRRTTLIIVAVVAVVIAAALIFLGGEQVRHLL